MSRHPKVRQPKPRKYKLGELAVRPVTVKDKWCYRPTRRNGEPVSPEEWGYIITLPSVPQNRNIVFEGFEGYTIYRSKKVAGHLCLQIILSYGISQYGISSQVTERPSSGKKKKQKQSVWSIRNLSKRGFNQ